MSVSDSLAEARRRRRQQKWGEIEIPEGDVEILDRLGKGGFGEVYMADYMGENVAVKVGFPFECRGVTFLHGRD